MGDPTAGTFSTNISDVSLIESNYRVPYKMNHISFLQHMKEEDEGFSGYPDLPLKILQGTYFMSVVSWQNFIFA